ncbi:hypothetical protein [Eisenbergiella sp.]
MRENFYEAAIRHFIDGCVLQQEESYDNAVCLFGNSAECALKSLIEVYCGENRQQILRKGYGHKGEELLKDLYSFLVNSTNTAAYLSLDPALGLKLQDFNLPIVLFQEHPERRYNKNGCYSDTDASECKNSTEFLINEMIRQHIDGYI